MRVLHTGRRIHMPSNVRTRPAPREIHTEYCRVLRPARRSSAACLYLFHRQPELLPRFVRTRAYHPKAKSPQCTPQKMMLKIIFEGVNCFPSVAQKDILAGWYPPLFLGGIKCRPATVSTELSTWCQAVGRASSDSDRDRGCCVPVSKPSPAASFSFRVSKRSRL